MLDSDSLFTLAFSKSVTADRHVHKIHQYQDKRTHLFNELKVR